MNLSSIMALYLASSRLHISLSLSLSLSSLLSNFHKVTIHFFPLVPSSEFIHQRCDVLIV